MLLRRSYPYRSSPFPASLFRPRCRTWFIDGTGAAIQIFDCSGHLCGSIVWLLKARDSVVPYETLKFADKKVILPGGTTEGLKMLPKFKYATG